MSCSRPAPGVGEYVTRGLVGRRSEAPALAYALCEQLLQAAPDAVVAGAQLS